jgi:hypothetical protein
MFNLWCYHDYNSWFGQLKGDNYDFWFGQLKGDNYDFWFIQLKGDFVLYRNITIKKYNKK